MRDSRVIFVLRKSTNTGITVSLADNKKLYCNASRPTDWTVSILLTPV